MKHRQWSFVSLLVTIMAFRLLSSLISGALLHYQVTNVLNETALKSHNTISFSSPVLNESLPLLTLGDLPGYTGWARPAYTEAPLYKIESISPEPYLVNQEITLVVACPASCTTSHQAQFYVRLYGRAILTGRIQVLGRARYEIRFLPRESGPYWMEVVLTYSNAPDVANFPLSKGIEPPYEGHLLPGFPRLVQVKPSNDNMDHGGGPLRGDRCTLGDLRVQSVHDGMYMATWRVVHKMNSMAQATKKYVGFNRTSITLEGYQSGDNSLGIYADFQPLNCNLVQPDQIADLSRIIDRCIHPNQPLRLILLGDSVTRMQMEYFEQLNVSALVKISYVSGRNGLLHNVDSFVSSLEALAKRDEKRILIFNSGLHDISVLCTKARAHDRELLPEYISCLEAYKEGLKDLFQYISSYPASLKIFQTTSAAWPRWGNFGFMWRPTMSQRYPLSTHFVDAFNRAAFEVLSVYEGTIVIMDGYWITLARPDNRQVDRENSPGKHMVHPGTEVLSALSRTWMTMVLSQIRCDLQ